MTSLERHRLLRDHRELDKEIQRISKQPFSDPLTLQRLKKQKLIIKDRLHLLAARQEPMEDVVRSAKRVALHA